jgi:outer membrane protein TolC
MKIYITILVIFLIQLSAFANISEYIESYTKYFDNESYKSFTKVVKGQASISDIEKQQILDSEISQELKTDFIYTDLYECIKSVITNNYEIKISDAMQLEDYWINKNAQVKILPDLFYNYYIANLSGNYLVGGIVSDSAHEVPMQSIFGMEWSTYNQGKYFFNIKETKHLYKSSVNNLEYTKEEAILNTVLTYYDLLGSKRDIEVQKINLYDRVEQLKYTEARFQAGIGTLYDVKRAQAEVAKAQQQYTEALYALRLLQAKLANIIGTDILDALYPYEIIIDSRTLINPDIEISDLYEIAFNNREDIKAKEHEISALRIHRNANYTDILPAISVSYQSGYVGTKRLGLASNSSITLNVHYQFGNNIFAGTVTQFKADTALLKQKELELTNLKRQIKEDILNSYYDSINYLKKIEASKVEVEAANTSLDLSISNMKNGEATFIDVIASQNLKVQANLNLIKNMIEYNKSQTKLLFDIGIISPKSVLKDYKKRFY